MDKKALIAAGFTPRTYEGQEGEFYVVERPAEAFAFCRLHVIDNEWVTGDMLTAIEICPGSLIQIYIAEGDYANTYGLNTPEGQELLQDALAVLKVSKAQA